MIQGTRTYPVPAAISASAPTRVSSNPVFDRSCQFASEGRVKGYQLPILASGPWQEGSEWARSILDREAQAEANRSEALLASVGYSDSYVYHGVLDSNVPDREVIVGLIRANPTSGGDPMEFWDGVDWGRVEFDGDDVEFVLLDENLLADVIDSFNLGIGAVALSPFRPKAWAPGESVAVQDFFEHLSPGYKDDYFDILGSNSEGTTVLASLGPRAGVDYEGVHRAVVSWARRTDPMVAGASRDTLRALLIREGISLPSESFERLPEALDAVIVACGQQCDSYPLGQPVTAAVGVGPDIVYAIVDEMDTSAVLDVIRVSPGPIAYKRQGGKWLKDQPTLIRLLGVDPPPVIELQPEQVVDVLGQVDAYDQANPPEAITAATWNEALHPRDAGKFATEQGDTAAERASTKKIAKKAPPPKKSRAQREADLVKAMLKALNEILPLLSTKEQRALLNRLKELAHAFIKGQMESPHHGGGGHRSGGSGSSKGSSSGSSSGSSKSSGGSGSSSKYSDGKPGKHFAKLPPGIAGIVEGIKRFLERDDGDIPLAARRKLRNIQNSLAALAGESSSSSGSSTSSRTTSSTSGARSREAGYAALNTPAAMVSAGWAEGLHPRDGGKFASKEGDSAGSEGAVDPKVKQDPVAPGDPKDKQFDIDFAKEGLSEARRREIFDKQIEDMRDRLASTNVSPAGLTKVIKSRMVDEKKKRDGWERARKTKAEQERVRRLQTYTATNVAASMVADASHMPGNLKTYWSKGRGAAKIRWGTSGDFNRCRKNLSKYLPPEEVSGACASLHHVATGTWPGKGRHH